MKKYLMVLLFSSVLIAQTEYVPVNHTVYSFLDRMDALGIITGYNSFELPKTRHEVASFIKEVDLLQNKLDAVDKSILNDLKTEFEYDLYGTLNNSMSLFGRDGYDPFSQKEKYLYTQSDSGRGSLFINLTGEADGIILSNRINNKTTSAKLGIIGGEIRGTILNKFGFYVSGTNGLLSGDKQTSYLRHDLQYNFKLNETPGSSYFDETAGYLTADFDLIKFKIGSDRLKIGYGYLGALIDDNSPPFDYIGMNISYGILTFSYFHAKIAGYEGMQSDSITQGVNTLGEKYIGYHRIGINASRYTEFGIGEFIIYANRPLEFAYVNPFNFYKSAEHSGKDRDNSMLFFDASNRSISGLKLYGYLLLDDIDFGKLFTGWYGNQTIWNLGLISSNLYQYIPLDIKAEYQRIEPYVFTHRLQYNNYTNLGYPLGTFTIPNSELFFTEFSYRFTYRLTGSLGYIYGIHGANPINPDGSELNIGGDIALGHRSFDNNIVHFLQGDLEYQRIVSVSINYEPYKEIQLGLRINYLNQSLQNSVHQKEVQSFLTIVAKL
ncbi:MAG: hypothetical protein P4L35_07880 [Ignavibacteriaceae bacterium]|nr:hypothetical protein [Ignavibacteriaceae bacterium]